RMPPPQLTARGDPADGFLIDDISTAVEPIERAEQHDVLPSLHANAVIQHVSNGDRRPLRHNRCLHIRLRPALCRRRDASYGTLAGQRSTLTEGAMFAGVDWAQVFLPDTSLVEIFVRGTITYFALFALLRYLRREAGTVGLSDLLVLVLIADAAQNAMAANYNSLTDGIFLVFTIIAWSYV